MSPVWAAIGEFCQDFLMFSAEESHPFLALVLMEVIQGDIAKVLTSLPGVVRAIVFVPVYKILHNGKSLGVAMDFSVEHLRPSLVDELEDEFFLKG